MSEFDTSAARLAGSQDNVISLSDVRRIGGSKDIPYTRVGREFWQRPHPGVYLHSAAPATWLQRARAAFLYCGNEAGATHRAGGYLYELDGVDEPDTIEFTMTQADRPAPDGVHVYRSRRPLKRTRWIDGIRVASVERVLLDLAGVLDKERLERAVESALLKRLTTEERIYLAIVEQGGRGVAGSKKLWRLMHDRPDGWPARSIFEIRTGHALRNGGLGHFVRNYPVAVDGEPFEIDKAFVDEKVAVESDGAAFHSTRSQRERDKRKQRKLEAIAWRFRRVRYSETLTADGRALIVEDVRALLQPGRRELL